MAILKDELICEKGNFVLRIGGDQPNALYFAANAYKEGYSAVSVYIHREECIKLAAKLLYAALLMPPAPE